MTYARECPSQTSMTPFFVINPLLQVSEKSVETLYKARLLVFQPSVLEQLWFLDFFIRYWMLMVP